MPANERQHFVPKFYLGSFASESKRIHLLNLTRGFTQKDVSLKRQCQRNYFYDNDNSLEGILSKLERATAPILKNIILNRELPGQETAEYFYLLDFIAIQRTRTVHALEELKAKSQAIHKAAVNSIAYSGVIDPHLSQRPDPEPGNVLTGAKIYSEALEGLSMLLIINEKRTFITSDHPIVEYNTYCQGIKNRGIRGPFAAGIQIFFPLSPEAILLLYDADVYQDRSIGDCKVIRRLEKKDVHQLNDLQIAGAHENVYFSDWNESAILKCQAENLANERMPMEVQAQEFVDVEGGSTSLIRAFNIMPNLRLDLSFIYIRSSLRSKKLSNRVGYRRKDLLDELSRRMPRSGQSSDKQPRVFRRRR